jgi:DNA-binding NtrC family response regulator
MQAITLYHLGNPIVHRPLSRQGLTIGSDPGDDLVLAGDNVAERHMTISRGPSGEWFARVRGEGGMLRESALGYSSRVPMGQYAVGLTTLADGGAPLAESRGAFRENAALTALVGVSARLRLVRYEIEKLGRLRVPVLVEGETGTGKELAARSLHAASNREGGPFVAVNCGAFSTTLLEDVLFGHERGSFTGASATHRGVFERAHLGTLFLDEIGELPLSQQASLLRVLDVRRVARIGSEREEEVDFRLVTATNRDLRQMALAGSFRADLYHRLATLRLKMPPLRDRAEDVAPLARHFLDAIADEVGEKELSENAVLALAEHAWPGNARELRNVLYRAAAVSPNRVLEASDLEIEAPRRKLAKSKLRLKEMPAPRICEAMQNNAGNITAAARELGVPRSTLRDHCRKGGATRDVTTASQRIRTSSSCAGRIGLAR